MLTLLLGPWGIPWGILHTLRIIGINLRGGIDVTSQLSHNMNHSSTSNDTSKAIGPAISSGPVG
jgi:hypothetical protein